MAPAKTRTAAAKDPGIGHVSGYGALFQRTRFRSRHQRQTHGGQHDHNLHFLDRGGMRERRVDIVMLTSLNEGTPVSLIEAQAANKPVITTRVGGIENVVAQDKPPS